MAYSKAQQKATAKYMKANLDDIKLRVKKGMRDIYKEEALNLGYSSFNDFAIKAIEEKLERERAAE